MKGKNICIDLTLKPWKSYSFNNVIVFFAGNLHYNNLWLSGRNAAEKLYLIFQNADCEEDIELILASIYGQFGFIIEFKERVIASTDKIRSFPIYYNNESLVITNNPAFKDFIFSSNIDKNALLEFVTSGYTLNNKTLFKCISQLTSGTTILINKLKNNFILLNYYKYYSNHIKIFRNQNEKNSMINDVVNSSIKNLIDIANERQIVIPLSAGYDSRLILAKLVEFGYKNILTYTYGTKTLWEINIARQSAELLGVNWEFIKFDKKTKKLFHTSDRREYYLNSSGYNSIPHLADYYALKILLSKNKIYKDALIVNGQSGDFITGGHIPYELKKSNFKLKILYQMLIDKHFSLWTNIINVKKNKLYIYHYLKEKLSFNDEDSLDVTSKKLDYFEFSERQTKYVINGQRAYDWLGLDWYLPLWSNHFLDFCVDLSFDDKLKQKLFIDYCLNYNPMNIFSLNKFKTHTISLPYILRILKFFLKIISRISKRINVDLISKKYFSYYEKYYPYYPQISLFEFIKDSKFHRHCVSYWVKFYLKENNIKNIYQK